MRASMRCALVVGLSTALLSGCDALPSLSIGETDQALVLTPASPSDLFVVAVNAAQANATWTDNSADETEFRLQRAEDEEFSIDLVEVVVPADTTQHTDFTTVARTTYFFRVLAVNANGASAPSEVVRVFTPASSPTVSVVTPSVAPAVFQSGVLNPVEALATGVGAEIASAEFQLVFQDEAGTYLAQELMAQPDDSPYVIPAPLSGSPLADTTALPALPPSAIVELQIYGRVAQAGEAGNGFEWRIGGTAGAPTFIVYESASTRFPRPRRPRVGDAVWTTALRTAAPGPLVATRVIFRAPGPQPLAPAASKLAALYKGTIESLDAAFAVPGVSYGGTFATVHNAVDGLSVPFRFDYSTLPGFPAFVDDGLIAGNAVEVRFWVSPPLENLPVARQVFPQVQPLDLPPVSPEATVIDDTPVPMGLPPGTFVQFMIAGVITDLSSDLMTFQFGIAPDHVMLYGHAATLPIADLFRAQPAIGDFVIATARRTLEPGPLVADQILILFDGPAPSFARRDVGIQPVYLFNGTVTDTGTAVGGSRWVVTGDAGPVEFIMDDPHDPAVLDRGPLPSLGMGSLVTVEFIPPTQVLPEDNWAPLSFDLGSSLWSALATLPAVSADRLGTLFVRTTDAAGMTRTVAIPAQLLAGVPNTAPAALDDLYEASGTETLDVPPPGVLGNDTDPDLGPLYAELVTAPVGTSAFGLNADGSFSFTYATNPAVDTPVSFTYRVSDGLDYSNEATVTVTVRRANLAPAAADDDYQATGTEPLLVPAPGVLGNDSDPESAPLSAELVSAPTGTSAFSLNADGSFSFTYGSNPPVATPVSFTYRVSDGLAFSDVATVTVVVGHANLAPVASGDGYLVTDTETLIVPAPGVLGNDFDPEFGPLTAQLVTPPAGTSAFSFNADGSFSFAYGSAPDVATPVTFTYQASDGVALSNVATVTVTIQPAEDGCGCSSAGVPNMIGGLFAVLSIGLIRRRRR